MVWIWEADSHVLINVQRVGLLSEIVRPDESTCFGGVVVFGAVRKVPRKHTRVSLPYDWQSDVFVAEPSRELFRLICT
jgi:hypothetical protein